MKTLRTLLTALSGSLALTVAALASDSSATFARIDLTDGRTLKDVTVRSYDPTSGRVLLLAGRTAMSLPLALIPAPFDEHVKEAVPFSGFHLSTVTPRVVETPTNAPAAAPAPRVVTVAAPFRELSEEAARASHREAAMTKARRFFTYEFQAGSSAVSVYDSDIEIEQTEAIPGWTGRYRTRGRAYLQFYDSRGRSFSRTTGRFEVITEQKPGKEIEVLDFTRLGEFR